MTEKTEKSRTLRQNKALHLYFTHLADKLNSAGYDMKKTLKESVDIPWDSNTIKNYIWRPIQEAQLGKKSTTELTTKEIDLIFDTINRHLGEKFGLHVMFPNIEELMLQMDAKNNNL
jgi:hypothetical protein